MIKIILIQITVAILFDAIILFLAEEEDLQEFGKFKPFRSVQYSGKKYPEYAVDGFIGGLKVFTVFLFVLHSEFKCIFSQTCVFHLQTR